MKGHRYRANPTIHSHDSRAWVTHHPKCSCGWEASQSYANAEIAHQAWEQHRDSIVFTPSEAS